MGLACTQPLQTISNVKLSLPVPPARFQGRTGKETKMLTTPCSMLKLGPKRMKPLTFPFVPLRHRQAHHQDRCLLHLHLVSDTPLLDVKGPTDSHMLTTTMDHTSDLLPKRDWSRLGLQSAPLLPLTSHAKKNHSSAHVQWFYTLKPPHPIYLHLSRISRAYQGVFWRFFMKVVYVCKVLRLSDVLHLRLATGLVLELHIEALICRQN